MIDNEEHIYMDFLFLLIHFFQLKKTRYFLIINKSIKKRKYILIIKK